MNRLLGREEVSGSVAVSPAECQSISANIIDVCAENSVAGVVSVLPMQDKTLTSFQSAAL